MIRRCDTKIGRQIAFGTIMTLFDKELADARREKFTKKEREYLIALLIQIQTEFESETAVGIQADYKEVEMVNNILATLRKEEF